MNLSPGVYQVSYPANATPEEAAGSLFPEDGIWVCLGRIVCPCGCGRATWVFDFDYPPRPEA